MLLILFFTLRVLFHVFSNFKSLLSHIYSLYALLPFTFPPPPPPSPPPSSPFLTSSSSICDTRYSIANQQFSTPRHSHHHKSYLSFVIWLSEILHVLSYRPTYSLKNSLRRTYFHRNYLNKYSNTSATFLRDQVKRDSYGIKSSFNSLEFSFDRKKKNFFNQVF